MADVFTRVKRSTIMAAIRSAGNRTTELSLAAAFRRNGVKGWRRHTRLPGRPDFTFHEAKVTVFVDGCFWHACPKHGHRTQSNNKYWDMKLEKNKLRDLKITRDLRKAGWKVVRFWEHEAKMSSDACAARVKLILTEAARGCTANRSANQGPV